MHRRHRVKGRSCKVLSDVYFAVSSSGTSPNRISLNYLNFDKVWLLMQKISLTDWKTLEHVL